MNRRYVQILLGFFLVLVGFNAIRGGGSPIGLIMGLGGVWLLFRQWEASRNRIDTERDYEAWRSTRERREYDFESMRTETVTNRGPQDQVYAHALEAVQAVGLDASTTPVLPVDIGVMAIRGDEPPRVYRTSRIPDNIDYIQPFVQLRIPTRATGAIKFELLDDQGQHVFLREDTHELSRGRNLIVPAARLPVHDALSLGDGQWSIRVSADGTVLAEHRFGWREADSTEISEHLEDDGEISNELRAAIAENRLEEMSLDELLDFQDDPPQRMRRGES